MRGGRRRRRRPYGRQRPPRRLRPGSGRPGLLLRAVRGEEEGGGVSRAAQAAADRATLGMRALRLQLELGEGEPPLLSAPYGAVARVTWIGALRSLTAMRGGGGERRLLRNSFGKPTTPADVAFAVLQKLVTGVGVRPSVAVAPPGASPANAAANAASYRLDERDFSMVLNAFVTDGRMDMAHRVMALQERTERAPPHFFFPRNFGPNFFSRPAPPHPSVQF